MILDLDDYLPRTAVLLDGGVLVDDLASARSVPGAAEIVWVGADAAELEAFVEAARCPECFGDGYISRFHGDGSAEHRGRCGACSGTGWTP